MERKIEFIVQAIKWFDRVNGNTYHSCRITRCADGAVLCCPYEYGYGDQYRQTALDRMAKEGWIPAKYNGILPSGGTACLSFERENNYPIEWLVSNGLKREVVALGKGE